MPEGDNVHLAARGLHRGLAGGALLRTDFRVPALATVDLTGDTMREVVARGKHILMRTESGWTIHSHLMMDGEWHAYPAGARWRAPAYEARVILETVSSTAVGFRVKKIDVVKTADEDALVGHLGPDLLGPDWDAAEALRRMRDHPDDTISAALLDQTIAAGWGNIYRNEICFLRGLDPDMLVSQVPDPDAVIALGKRLIEANREHARHVTTGDMGRGRQRWVYGRGGKPCLRCGTRIVRTPASDPERVTYRCPSCQPAVSGSKRAVK